VIYGKWSVQASKQANTHTHGFNEVTLVWGEPERAPTIKLQVHMHIYLYHEAVSGEYSMYKNHRCVATHPWHEKKMANGLKQLFSQHSNQNYGQNGSRVQVGSCDG